jgi:hypothetical protein
MIERPIWFTPTVCVEYPATAYKMPVGWLVVYTKDERLHRTWVWRLTWSNHFDRLV